MRKETYLKIFQRIQSVPNGVKCVQISGKVLTYATALCYMAVLVGNLLWQQWRNTLFLLLVPAVSFVVVSIFRGCLHAKRPYEVYDFIPLIEKDTKEKSFPSRHVFSIFVIGGTLAWFSLSLGLLICLMGCVLAVIRVAVGVHFPKDVIAGAMTGVVCSVLAGMIFL